MHIFHKEVSLEEGFRILDEDDKESRLLSGKKISRASGWLLFKSMQGQEIKCWNCECIADRWIAEKGRSDKMGSPVLNLWGTAADGHLVMMTRDHIIPKSKGGVDDIANLRPGCADCNSSRGNVINKADREFMKAHPELINEKRKAEADRRAAKHKLTEAEQNRRVERLALKKLNKFPRLSTMMALALA